MTLFLARCLVENRWREAGAGGFLSQVGPLALMNILVVGCLFSSARPEGLSLGSFALNYVYFVPLFSFLAAVNSFDAELFAGLGEQVLLGGGAMLRARLLLVVLELAVPSAFFLGLLWWTGRGAEHFALLGASAAVFALLGLALGLSMGFRHEKALNNMAHVSTWLFGLGPGPLFGLEVQGYHRFFLGGHALTGQWGLEAAKLAALAVVAVLILAWARRPRSRPLYA